MLVWQNSPDAYDCTKLILMNLNTGNRQEIQTENQNRMLPLGFIGEDLIYGVVAYDDIRVDFSGSVTFPMHSVFIQDERGEVLKTYKQDGVYVTDAVIKDNLITLTRVVRDGQGGYTSAEDDQIVNNLVEEGGYNSSEVVVTQYYEKIVQLVLKNALEVKNQKLQNRYWRCLRGTGFWKSPWKIRSAAIMYMESMGLTRHLPTSRTQSIWLMASAEPSSTTTAAISGKRRREAPGTRLWQLPETR